MQHTHKKRLVSIDTLKGFSVLFMIFIHIPMYLILIEEKTSFSYFILNTFAKISAPIFLFFVGFNLFLSIHNNKTPKKNIAKKSLYFFAIGLIFSLIWTPDIIHFIGFFMLFLLLIARYNKKIKFFMALLVLIISPILLVFFDYASNWVSIPYVYNSIWTLSGFFKHLFVNGVYPFFPWVIFPLTGFVCGEMYIEHTTPMKKNQKRTKQMKVKENPQSLYYKNMLLFSLSLIIIALVVRMLFNIPMTFYPATQTYVLMALGVTIFSFALFFREYDMTNNKEKIFSFIGKNSFSFYILHVVIGIVPFMVLDLFNFFTFMGVMIYTIFVTGIIALICYYSGKKYGLGPIELLVKKLP